MGKIVKQLEPLDVANQIVKTMEVVRKYVSKAGCNVGTVDYDRLLGAKICIVVENDGKLGSDIAAELFGKCARAFIVKEVVECEGSYDWRADTYIRPSSAILVEFK
jgi:hypothetical protein